jgi:hypothetical protein
MLRKLLVLLATLVALLALSVPTALADDDDDDDGGGGGGTQTFVLASADTDTEYSFDGGLTWTSAVLVEDPHLAWQAPVSAWISSSSDGSSGNRALIQYRRIFTLPAGCEGTLLTVQVNADNEATLYLNDAAFGSTIPVFAFQEPTETFATVGPFFEGQNVLRFDVRNFGDPNALDYRAEVTCTSAGDGDDDDDDDDDDGGDGDGDDDDDD